VPFCFWAVIFRLMGWLYLVLGMVVWYSGAFLNEQSARFLRIEAVVVGKVL